MNLSTENNPLISEIRHLVEQLPQLEHAPNDFVELLSEELAQRLSKKQNLREKNNKYDFSSLKQEISTVHYYMPSVVSLVYTQNKPTELQAYAHAATEQHFNFLQRAVTNVVRRFSGYVRNYQDGLSDLEEEMWGQTLEDIMRQLTDRHARVWSAQHNQVQLFPPDIQKRGNHGAIARLALSSNLSTLACFHTDQCVSIWNVNSQEEKFIYDLKFLHENSTELTPDNTPIALHFSRNEKFLGIEYANALIAALPLNGQSEIKLYHANDVASFFKEFGSPVSSYRNQFNTNHFESMIQQNMQVLPASYLNSVYDWVCTADGNYLATASNTKREMPSWMLDIGFERSIYVIVKRRLIDWIRKNNHFSYICWYCGTSSASHNDTQCKNCGKNFSDCLLNLPEPPCDHPTIDNNWTCSHCGLSSRTREPVSEPTENDLFGERLDAEHQWQDQHDLERIKQCLQGIFITYKKNKIQCNYLLELKAQGLTNEEIGDKLQVPRGSVDYLWTQCRDHIIKYFDQIW